MLDFDETLVTGDIIKDVSIEMHNERKIDKIYTGKDVDSFDLTGLPENLKERVLEAFSESKYYKTKKAIPEAYHFLCALKMNGHRLSVLTARPITLKMTTIVTLVEQFPNVSFDNILFANKEESVKLGNARPNKAVELEKHRPDYYFDDSIEYCNMAAELGIESYLISNTYTAWNHNYNLLHKKVKPIKHIGLFPGSII